MADTKTTQPVWFWLKSNGGCLPAEIVALHKLVLLEFGRAATVKHDFAMDDDIAAVGDADCLVQILLSHEHGQAPAFLQLPDLVGHLGHEEGLSPTEGPSWSSRLGWITGNKVLWLA